MKFNEFNDLEELWPCVLSALWPFRATVAPGHSTTREQRIQASKTSAGIIRCAGLMHLWVLGGSVPRLGVCQRQRVRPNFQLKRKSVLEGPCETAQAMPAPIPKL